jgi:hypothetical protein
MEANVMAESSRRKPHETATPHVQSTRKIPADATGGHYAADLARYLDRLLDEALEETFPASDAVAVPSQRELEKR